MRGQTLGTDRWGRRYWRLADQRVWVQPRTPRLSAVVDANPNPDPNPNPNLNPNPNQVVDAPAPDAAGDDAWQLFEGAEVRRAPLARSPATGGCPAHA